MTRADLSRVTGISYHTLYGYESGTRVPRVRNLIKLAWVLKVASIDVLLFGLPRAKWRKLRS